MLLATPGGGGTGRLVEGRVHAVQDPGQHQHYRSRFQVFTFVLLDEVPIHCQAQVDPGQGFAGP